MTNRSRAMALAAAAGIALAPTLLMADVVTLNAPANASSASNTPIGHANALSEAFRSVAASLRPSVVQIIASTEAASDRSTPGLPDLRGLPEQFRDMVPRMAPPQQGQRPRMGQGTGVVISSDGLVLTNNHVIDGATSLRVVMHDGEELDGEIVGTDPDTDLAILKVQRSGLVAAEFGDSDSAMVGDWVVALGSPFGLQQTVTAGIVSAIGRETVGLARFENYIQTDAAINPGNSGGPLVNLSGQVVGINTAISSAAGGNDGVGFAIPSRMVMRVVNDLASDGTMERGWLGVNIQQLDEDLAASFDFPNRHGVLVSGVVEDTPADRAGLQVGDIITAIDGRRVATTATLARTIAQSNADADVEIEFTRDGTTRSVTATLEPRPNDGTPGPNVEPEPIEEPSEKLGLQLAPLTPDLRSEAGLESEEGVFIEGVDPTGAAALSGLQPGDLIIRIGNAPVTTTGEVGEALASLEEGAPIRLLIERRGVRRFLLINRNQ